jgi:hypothetical protein
MEGRMSDWLKFFASVLTVLLLFAPVVQIFKSGSGAGWFALGVMLNCVVVPVVIVGIWSDMNLGGWMVAFMYWLWLTSIGVSKRNEWRDTLLEQMHEQLKASAPTDD